MTELTLIRHAQSRAQTGEEPWLDPDLTPLGQRQARAAATYFSGNRFDLTIVSPLLRARKTFELMRVRTTEIQFDARLVEVTLNRGPGYDYRALLPYLTPSYGRPDQSDMWLAPAGRRVASLLAELRGFPGRVLMVGHCGTFHVIRHYLLGDPIDGEPMFDRAARALIMDNVALTTARLGASPRHDAVLQWNQPLLPQPAVVDPRSLQVLKSPTQSAQQE